MTVRRLDGAALAGAADLVAREQARLVAHRPLVPAAYTDPEHCRVSLEELLAAGYAGFVAESERGCVGMMCGRAIDTVGFVPAHGLAVDPDLIDATPVIVALLAELAPILVGDGAVRFTVDHADLDVPGAALNNACFGRGGVFATQRARAAAPLDVDVRVGTPDDLDAIAALSQIELAHRSTPPIYSPPSPRTLDEARAVHERLLTEGAIHSLARGDGGDVGLLTLEFTSPAPRLCPDGYPYIGATATRPSARGRGIGRALVRAALDRAHRDGHETVSVDFESSNPLSRPFWLGMGFQPVGYRVRRMLDASYLASART